MRLYISGAITGVEGFRQMFLDAETALETVGFKVENPVKAKPLCRPMDPEWRTYMRADIILLAQCDGVATISGDALHLSKGARIECDLAYGLGLPVQSVAQWIEMKRRFSAQG